MPTLYYKRVSPTIPVSLLFKSQSELFITHHSKYSVVVATLSVSSEITASLQL